MTGAVRRLAAHAAGAQLAAMPAAAVAAARTFLLDTLGVGLAGSSGTGVADLVAAARGWGAGDEATVWLTGERLPAPQAAVVNAYQIHCLEFDCVHEGAVLHPMATILAAALAFAERESARGRPVPGAVFLAALAAGVDVATLPGAATSAPIRFFRPATLGGLGAAAACGRMAGFDEGRMMDALGAQYAQMSGTLQPHAEGSPMLGLQVGLNARAALCSADLAAAGFRGPHDILTGRYGYFPLFEGDAPDMDQALAPLGRDWQVTRLSHKPFPSGRLTHGVVDGLSRLMAQKGFAASDVAAVTAHVPPLVHRLVGRPDLPAPEANYAKLCLPFVAGVFLARGRVTVPDFRGDSLTDPAIHREAAKVSVVLDANPDPNALDPQTIEVRLTDGTVHAITLPHVIGHPEVPLSPEENRAKFRACAALGRRPLSPERVEALIEAVERVETLPDAAALARMTLP